MDNLLNSKLNKIGLIAGDGQFPIIFSKAAKKHGIKVYAVGYINETDPALKEFVVYIKWLHPGQIRRLIKYFKENKISDAVMIGAIKKTRMFSELKLDTKAIAMLIGMRHTHDDNILRAFASTLQKEGINIKSSTFLIPDMLAKEGCWTKKRPTSREKKDIKFGWNIAKKMGRLDIGQCVVVGGGSVLAVEAIEGTDAAIRRGGELGNGEAVVIKICKPNQDTRFDIPAIGAQTIITMKESGARTLAVEAGKTVVFDKQEMIRLADELGISIVALCENNK
mmetsp:Transcript_21517/g.9968  ORF Transcript_21517/g.9968 Transcript_21517/m.9968 type:complete len:280 (+) Transcript_21517:6985-7824(+)